MQATRFPSRFETCDRIFFGSELISFFLFFLFFVFFGLGVVFLECTLASYRGANGRAIGAGNVRLGTCYANPGPTTFVRALL